MKNKLRKLNYILIGAIIIFQPFIVMFQAMIVRDVQLFGLSVFEFFNIITMMVSFGITVYLYEDKRKFLKFVPYILILGVYMILHGLHIYQFDNEVYPLQTPNFFVESYYIFRTFIVPLLLIFNIYYSEIKKEHLIKLLEILIFIVVIVIVVTNLFNVALQNYSDENVYNAFNLWDWFNFENTSRYSYYQLTSKGWFLSGNQMSAILFMSFPVILYRTYMQRDKFHYLLVVLQMLAMFMLGTKTANVGCILICIMFVGLWIFFKILKHNEKGIGVLLLITLVFAGLIQFSPVGYMMKYENGVESSSTGSSTSMLDSAVEVEDKEGSSFDYEKLRNDSKILKKLDPDKLSEDEKIFVKEYMEEFCSFFGISPYIIEHYNDLEHSVFWTRYIQEIPNNDYRVLKTMILEDIYHNNNNSLDKYLGMGYTLNYIYTEADYTYQLYNYGLVGILVLVGPYFFGLLYVIYQGVRNFKKMFKLECAMYFVAPLLGLCVAKMSGHVLERTFPLLVLAVLICIILMHTRECVGKTV